MKYTSTRDATRFYTFEEALFSGYAPDGGLFVPTELPSLLSSSNEVLAEEWPKLGYTDLATEILHPFIGDEGMSKHDLRSLLGRALAKGFDVPNTNLVPVVPMVRTNGTNGNDAVDCYVAELFHGPTNCFKDLGMRATIFLLDFFASKRATHNSSSNHAAPSKVVLTAATTGDTGPAAVQAVQDLDSPYLGIVVHYPEGQISDFQRKQMTTVVSDRVEIVSFDGGGDDMDRPIKNIMTKQKHRHQHQSGGSGSTTDGGDNGDRDDNSDKKILVCGVNSYNIGRPLMQMVHFIWTYLRVVEQIETKTNQKIDHGSFRLDVVIPTGAMGNIAGCYMAKKIGVPFGNLCAGVNINDFTHRAFSTGKVQKPKSGEPMKPSLSDAINIQLPYNLERLLFYLTGQDHAQVKIWYDRLECNRGESSSSIDLTEEISSDHSASEVDASTERTINSNNNDSWLAKLQTEFRSARVTDSALCATIQNVLETYGYWADPHTGVAFDAAKQLGYLSTSLPEEGGSGGIGGGSGVSTSVVAIMATASPCKFEAAMTKILGLDKWKEYELYHFPTRGKDLKDKKEKSPLRYLADEGKTLKENQLAWESKTKELIAKLGR